MEDSHSSHSQNHHSPSDHAAGSAGGARYRLLSPAKLPISRSASISIPPGLSPTSLLESPVLLSNIKAEPSPTTGSFFMRQWMQGSGENGAPSLDKNISSGDMVDETTSSNFEFRFQTGASSISRLSSTGMMIPVGLNRNVPVNHQNQCYSQSSARVQRPSTEHKDSVTSIPAERTSDDGYNWRKYGQKLVKGSEFPRSYYKCTYTNCEVKKIFERSPSGQITEIVYKGSHDHPKPQAPRRHNPGALLSIQEDKLDKDLSTTGQEDKSNTSNMEPDGSPMLSPLHANEDGIDAAGSQSHGINDDVEDDDHIMKRRRMEDCIDVTPIVKPIREPRVVVQTLSEVDILDDGYRWRKYGQKVVRGNPNPRSYYKCTNAGCPVRKHVERASHDPKAVITTYEGKHSHEVPTAKNSSHDYYAGTVKMRPQDGSSISLDLGVGIGRTNGQQMQALDAESARNQIGSNNPHIPACYGIVNSSLNLYGNRENSLEDSSFQTPPTHPTNQCQQNVGRVLMGP